MNYSINFYSPWLCRVCYSLLTMWARVIAKSVYNPSGRYKTWLPYKSPTIQGEKEEKLANLLELEVTNPLLDYCTASK